MAEKIQKTIPLKAGRDAAIARWSMLIRENWDGGQSYLIKRALTGYINARTYTCIGKVHCNPEIAASVKYGPICIWLKDSPQIVAWTNSLAEAGLKPVVVMREVLRHCIEIVPEDEPEWVPSCLDQEFQMGMLDMLNTQYEQAMKKQVSATAAVPVQLQAMESVPVQETVQAQAEVIEAAMPMPEAKAEMKTISVPPIQEEIPPEPPVSRRKRPRAAALGGKCVSH